jgi:hypothetical protein
MQYIWLLMFISFLRLEGYGLPPVNLGSTSFFDGFGLLGRRDWSYQQYNIYYHSNTFKDAQGNVLPGIINPQLNVFTVTPQGTYQAPENLLFNAKPGISALLPIVFYERLNPNQLGIKSSGSGFSDFVIAPFLQWDLIWLHERPFFIHRFACYFSFPTGKNRAPEFTVNPGNGFYLISPHWAATIFFTHKLSSSWRLHYLWCSFDKRNCRKLGNTFHMNFDLTYEIENWRLYVGVNGYYLQQLQNNKVNGVVVPDSKERVVGLGPGVMFLPTEDFFLFGNLYFEFDVRNRPKGVRAVFRFAKNF